jgi:hypothetical protein
LIDVLEQIAWHAIFALDTNDVKSWKSSDHIRRRSSPLGITFNK